MIYKALADAIQKKESFLCVGLDGDRNRMPASFRREKNPLLSFNRAVIEETNEYAVAYKFNLAFYEQEEMLGLEALIESLSYIPADILAIADAKRGDIGSTAVAYATTYLERYDFGGITVSPYLGLDSLSPFLAYKDKWTIILGITSNPGAANFQALPLQSGVPLYEQVVKDCATWGSASHTMFVVGATQLAALRRLRSLLPAYFFLVPGVGAQGGNLTHLSSDGMNASCGLLVNVSRSILYPEKKTIHQSAAHFARLMRQHLHDYLPPNG